MKLFNMMNMSYGQYSSAVRSYISRTFSKFNQKYSNSTIFGQIITVIEATVQNIMLYIEDAFVEQNKFTAQRKKSIFGLAQLSGYNPSLGKSAGMHVKLSYIPNNSQSLSVVIPNHTPVVCSQNGLMYQIVLPQDAVVISANKDCMNKYFYVVEGEFETQNFLATGGKLYLQHVKFNGDIDEDYIEVRVNNEVWERSSSLYDMAPDGKQWFYKTSIISGIIIGFGNDVYGRSIKENDIITVSYLKHAGEYGNVNAAETIKFSFVNNLKDVSGDTVDGNTIFHMTLANKDNVTSGTFSEDQEQVKQMIGYTSRSMVLASPENYKSFISRFSFCGYNRTWSEPGSLVVNSLIMRNYKSQLKDGKDYFSLIHNEHHSDFCLTDRQKESVQNCIINSGRQLAGVVYNIYDPEICKYALYVYIKPKAKEYDTNYMESNIRAVLGEYFSNIVQDNYIPKSDIIKLIKDTVKGVDGVDCYFVSERNEQAISRGSYIDRSVRYNPSTNTYDIHEVEISVPSGTDPSIGLDAHGNICLDDPTLFPIINGGWNMSNRENPDQQGVHIDNPLIVVFE